MTKRKNQVRAGSTSSVLPLTNLRTLLPDPSQSEPKLVAIVGAGVAGLSVVSSLLTKGKRVCLLEQKPAISNEHNFLAQGSISAMNPGRSCFAGLHYKSPETAWILLYKNQRAQWLQYKVIRKAVEIKFFIGHLNQLSTVSEDSSRSEKQNVAYGLMKLIDEGDAKELVKIDTEIVSQHAEDIILEFENTYAGIRENVVAEAKRRFNGIFRQGPEVRNIYAAIPSNFQNQGEMHRTILTTKANIALGKWIVSLLFSTKRQERLAKKAKVAVGLKEKAKAAYDRFAENECQVKCKGNPGASQYQKNAWNNSYARLWKRIVKEIESRPVNSQEKLEFFESCYPEVDNVGSFLDWADELGPNELALLKTRGIISPETAYVAHAYSERQWDPVKLGAEMSKYLRYYKNTGRLQARYNTKVTGIRPSGMGSGLANQVVSATKVDTPGSTLDVDHVVHGVVCAYKDTLPFMAHDKVEAHSESSSPRSDSSSSSSSSFQAEPRTLEDQRRQISWRHKVILEIDLGVSSNIVHPAMFIFGTGNPGGAMVTPLGDGKIGITQIEYTNVLCADHTSGDGNNLMPFSFCGRYSVLFNEIFTEYSGVLSMSTSSGLSATVCSTLQEFFKKAAVIRFCDDEESVQDELKAIHAELISRLSGMTILSFEQFNAGVSLLVNKLKIQAAINIIEKASVHHPWLKKYSDFMNIQGDNFELNRAFQMQGGDDKVSFGLRQGNVVNSGESNIEDPDPFKNFNKRNIICTYADSGRPITFFVAAKASTAISDAEIVVENICGIIDRNFHLETRARQLANEHFNRLTLPSKFNSGPILRIIIKSSREGVSDKLTSRDGLRKYLESWCVDYLTTNYSRIPKGQRDTRNFIREMKKALAAVAVDVTRVRELGLQRITANSINPMISLFTPSTDGGTPSALVAHSIYTVFRGTPASFSRSSSSDHVSVQVRAN